MSPPKTQTTPQTCNFIFIYSNNKNNNNKTHNNNINKEQQQQNKTKTLRSEWKKFPVQNVVLTLSTHRVKCPLFSKDNTVTLSGGSRHQSIKTLPADQSSCLILSKLRAVQRSTASP